MPGGFRPESSPTQGRVPRSSNSGEVALTYSFADFSDLLRDGFSEVLPKVVAEVAGSGGEKDPAVARVIAIRTQPPPAIIELWEQLKSCILP